MKQVDVVGAVIRNESGDVLCALRSETMSMPNLWEFPGGKIDPGETPEETLVREIREELGCDIRVGNMVEDTLHDYPGVRVRLITYEATIIRGTPVPREHAELRWLPVSELETLNWAPADIPAVKKIVREQAVK
ncbi:(deoxy)nucleoside triphosphate pyrophosphohydrolase [Staphylospora marina]|uniref:(deoxy)nucleoside triphosphate pyrophosphohydrolase n=1 Tax=Staphylospora marina TaxID=2490858 RepID=UPI000F5C1093|nr:(deoxy)nucleoside triphosphate pyrophosphohydrolase [Staphylospora marina]